MDVVPQEELVEGEEGVDLVDEEEDLDDDLSVEQAEDPDELRRNAPVVCPVRQLYLAVGATLDDVKAAVEADPEALTRVDQFGWLLIHWAIEDFCYNDVEGHVELMEYLVERCPLQALQTRTADHNHFLPIHVVCAFCCELLERSHVAEAAEVVRLMLLKWPAAAQAMAGGVYPVEFIKGPVFFPIARRIIETWPGAIDAAYQNGTCLLHDAIELPGDSEETLAWVQFLVTRQPSIVRQTNSGGKTALHWVCGETPPDVVLYLLDQWKYFARQRDHYGRLPLHDFVDAWEWSEWGNREDWLHVLRVLCRQCPRSGGIRCFYGETPLAIAAGRVVPLRVIRTLVREWRPSVQIEDFDGRLPIHLLFKRKNWVDPVLTPIARFLIQEFPASLRAVTHEGDTPLLVLTKAARRQPNHVKIALIELLVSADPDSVRVPNKKWMIPLHSAARNRVPPESLRCLVDAAPETCRLQDADGWTALHHAMARDRPSMTQIKYLVQQCPASIHFTTCNGSTALHLALERSAPRMNVVSYLAEQDRGSLLASNRQGMVPVHIAATCNDSADALQYLIKQAPQSLRIRDRTDSLALHTALRNGKSLDFVRPMVEGYPASVGRADGSRSLPMHILLASDDVDPNMVRYFLEHQPRWLNCLRVPNGVGQLPLEVAVANDVSLDILFLLIRKDPGLIYERRISKKRKRQ